MPIPTLLTIKDAVTALGGLVSEKSLRREIAENRLRAHRARPGSNAPILIAEPDLEAWFENVAGKRQVAPSPRGGSR